MLCTSTSVGMHCAVVSNEQIDTTAGISSCDSFVHLVEVIFGLGASSDLLIDYLEYILFFVTSEKLFAIEVFQ